MTIAPDTPPLIFRTVEEASDELRVRGMRLSTARRLVLEALFAAEGPVSAVHLAGTLSIDSTSVYRNLEVLERHGLVRHVHLGHGPGLYVLVGRHEVEYLYCDRCAKVTPVAPDELDPVREQLKHSFGFEVRFSHFALVGLCAACAKLGRLRSPRDAETVLVDSVHGHHQEASTTRANRGASAHEHMHSHGDHVHSHQHVHQKGRDGQHEHGR